MQQKEIQEKSTKDLALKFPKTHQDEKRDSGEKRFAKGGEKTNGMGEGEEGLTKWSMLQEAPKLDQGGRMKPLVQEKQTPKSGHPMQLTDLKAKML